MKRQLILDNLRNHFHCLADQKPKVCLLLDILILRNICFPVINQSPINSLSIYGSMATPHGWHLPELNLSYNPMLTAYKQVVSSG